MGEPKFCLCSDPDYCLRRSEPAYRQQAIAYRREHGAPLPKGLVPNVVGENDFCPFGYDGLGAICRRPECESYPIHNVHPKEVGREGTD